MKSSCSTEGRRPTNVVRRHERLSLAHFAWVALLLPVAATVAACVSSPEVPIGTDCEDGFCTDGSAPPPTFTPPPSADGGEAGVEEPTQLLECIGTDCPYPYADCSKSPSSFRCQTNLMNDPANCGACGVSCLGFGGINMGASCIEGKCVFECQIKPDSNGENQDFRDCNGLLDDGCEANTSADPEHCGACGNVCPSGMRCIKGRCGCPTGLTDCDGRCVDTRFADNNCSTCGNMCPWMPQDACSPMPFQTQYGCVMSECGKLKCKSGFKDCNGDLNKKGCASDGCETEIAKDPKNCGGCGIECAPDQECRNDGYGPQCLDKCSKSGLTQCNSGCKDLLSDQGNCGACNNSCPNPRANQVRGCKKGVCVLECVPGFADCNGDPSDGCEVDLTRHPAHCGACGNECDLGAGQPCIEGKCRMVECDGGVETTK